MNPVEFLASLIAWVIVGPFGLHNMTWSMYKEELHTTAKSLVNMLRTQELDAIVTYAPGSVEHYMGTRDEPATYDVEYWGIQYWDASEDDARRMYCWAVLVEAAENQIMSIKGTTDDP